MEGSVNDQITDATTQLNTLILGNAAPHSLALLDVTSAETLGMAMHNAVSSQQNAQISASAATTSVCAKMLQTRVPPTPTAKEDVTSTPPPFMSLDGNTNTASGLINQANTLAEAAVNLQNKTNANKDVPSADLQKLIDTLQTLLKNSNTPVAPATPAPASPPAATPAATPAPANAQGADEKKT